MDAGGEDALGGTPLLGRVIDAHGGLARWNALAKVEAEIIGGGRLFRFKGSPPVPGPRRLTVWLHEQRAMAAPASAADRYILFTPTGSRSKRRTGRSSPSA